MQFASCWEIIDENVQVVLAKLEIVNANEHEN